MTALVPRHLDLDFVAPPLATRVGRWLLAAGVAAFAVGAVHLTTTWLHWQQQKQALDRLPRPDESRSAPPTRAEVAGLRAAQGVTRELTAPWSDLLDAIEAAGTKDVVLVAVEPMLAQQSVRITADARHADAMLDLVAKLKRQALGEVTLVSHQVQAQRPGTPLRFQVQARWHGRPTAGAKP